MSFPAPLSASGITIDTVPVGNPGNVADMTTGFGSVGYAYNIGKYEVTASQYVEFLNVKDATGANTLGLYDSSMSNATYGGISFTAANPGGSKYSVIAGRENHPVNFVTWYDSIRFANWLNNGQGSGDTETGAYTLGTLDAGGIPTGGPSITRNAGATWFLTSENEWYKAAYHKNDGVTGNYFAYPTSNDAVPTAEAPPGGSNSANYNLVVGDLTNVGAYTDTKSPYGAFDLGGNVFEWDEASIGGGHRGVRGGSFFNDYGYLLSSIWSSFEPRNVASIVGFRVATVPEPSTVGLLAIGGIAWTWFAAGRLKKRRLEHHRATKLDGVNSAI